MRIKPFIAAFALSAVSLRLFAQTLAIDHGAVGCAVAEKFPRLEARFSPAESVAAARVVFQPEQGEHWWSVAMKQEGNAYVGVLPKPKSSLKAFRYYVEVTGKELGTARTPEHTAVVVPSAGGCQGKVMSGALGSASVLLQGPVGVAAIPGGFASAGVVAGSSTAGAAGAGAAAAGGGGVGAGVIIAGVGAALAGTAVVVGKSEADDLLPNNATPTPTPATIYDVTFTPPATLDLRPCGANAGITGLADIRPDAGGNFNTLQTQATPVMRMTGQVTPTTFQASLACTNGASSGSISASGANDSYSGSFSFAGSGGGLTVRKR
jgi:hypothetical protein